MTGVEFITYSLECPKKGCHFNKDGKCESAIILPDFLCWQDPNNYDENGFVKRMK